MNTLAAQEIKLRGISAMDDIIKVCQAVMMRRLTPISIPANYAASAAQRIPCANLIKNA